MYQMLTRDSVLLEMLRENAWRNYESREYSTLSSSELMKQGKQHEIFLDLLEYIDYFCELEDDITWELSPNDYKKLFGNESPVERLLKGVKNSLEYSGIIRNPLVFKKYNEVYEKVISIKKI